MAGTYEVEVKSLLGSTENAEALRTRLRELDPNAKRVEQSKQLNHYFIGGDPAALAATLAPRFASDEAARLGAIARDGKNVSVRTRQLDGEARFIMKASLGDDSSANGVIRAEFDEPVPGVSFEELDALVLAAGYQYQAKWSRAREAYQLGDGMTICIDKNAGYGHVAEFERVVDDAEAAPGARADILALMNELGVVELPQDRLERMFAHYNAHWPEYYGTDKIFIID